VPVEITVKLLLKAMQHSETKSFLVDGFPRSLDNYEGWCEVVGDQAEVVCCLFYECGQAELERRLLDRGKTSGRDDDNIESIKKRFLTYMHETAPVAEMFRKAGKLVAIRSEESVEQVWLATKEVFDSLESKHEISREMVCGVVKACREGGSEEIQVGKLRSVCEECGVPLGAISGILQMIIPPDDSVGSLPWSHFVVALCAQVEGVENVGVAGVVRLLLDPGMFGNDQGHISKADFIGLFDWWSSIDTSISAELKSALFSALDTRDDKVRDAACMHALARRVAEQ